MLEDKRGMSYYIIRKNAKVEIVRNPAYKIVNKVGKVDMDKLIEEKGITPKRNLIKQIEKNSERFEWMFQKDIMDF